MGRKKKFTKEYLELQLGDDIKRIISECDCPLCRHSSLHRIPVREWCLSHSTEAGSLSSIHNAIQREYGITTQEFLEKYHGIGEESEEWRGESPETHRWLNDYLEMVEDCREYADSTRNQIRSIMNRHIDFLRKATGEDNLVILAYQGVSGNRTVREGFEILNDELEYEESKRSYADYLIDFYKYLDRERAELDTNPAEKALENFKWKYTSSGGRTTPLTFGQVQLAWAEAETLMEQCVVGMCTAGGANTGDASSVLVSDIYLDGDDPRIEFHQDRSKERGNKDDDETVVALCGEGLKQALRMQIQENNLGPEDPLFPSVHSNKDHMSPATIRGRFKDVMRRADITLPDGRLPTPRNGRNFRHDKLDDIMSAWEDKQEQLTEEMGKTNPEVTDRHYITEKKKRAYIRKRKKELFTNATQPQDVVGYTSQKETGSTGVTTLDDF
jgi:hypothetical protein